MICADCGREWPLDRFNPECASPESCFRCRAGSVGVGFQGGKEYFHEDTEKRRRDLAISEAKAAGIDPVPYHYSAVHASATSIKGAGDVSKSHGAWGKPLGAPTEQKAAKAVGVKGAK